MGIFVKALLKSLKDKKARTALILFSIAVSAALLYANESFARVCEQKFYQADVRWGGNSDIVITAKETVGAKEWIDAGKLSGYADQFGYEYRFIQEKALYAPTVEQMHYFTMIGADIDEFNSYNPISLERGSFQDWTGFKAVIGTTYAQKYNLKINDTMKLELNGKQYDFKIVAVSMAKGLFVRELADGGFVIVPRDTLAGIFNGGTNLVFIKLKDSTKKDVLLEKFTAEFSDYKVDYGVNDSLIAQETANYVMPFRVSSVAVIFMSAFIIFTAFNLVTRERIPLIGTLRSVGCSRKRINTLLIAESAVLGALGGLTGCLLGVGVLEIIVRVYFANDVSGIASTMAFGSRATLTAVIAAVVITTASAIIPILRITKTPIRSIILNDIKGKQRRKSKLWAAGFVLMAACAIVPRYLGIGFGSMIIGNVVAMGALIGMIPLVQFLTFHLSRFAGEIPLINYNIALGLRNVCDNKNLMNNVQLFSAAIAIVAFMSSIFNSMGSDLIKAYEEDTRYDVLLVTRHTDRQTLSRVSAIDGVDSCIGSFKADTAITNRQSFFNMLYGIDGADFFEYNIVTQLGANREALANLNNGKNIITTNILKDKLGLKLGDILTIRFGSREVDYLITGFVETNLGIGHVGYISAENFREDMGVSGYSEIYIKAKGDPRAVKNNILRALTKDVMRINTKEELLIANSDKVVPMFRAISVYSYIALLVGLIGIFNNLAASFLERKRSFAMLRSIGMSRKNLNRMLVAEAAGMGLCGIIFGLFSAIVMSTAIPAIVSIFWGKVTAIPAYRQMAVMGIAGMLAMLAIAAVPIVKSNKLSIIEGIKYE